MEKPNILELDLSNDNGQTTDKTEGVPMEIVKDDEVTPVPRLRIKDFDDEGEEVIRLTVEEAQNYIVSKALAYAKDPEINPLLNLKNDIETLNGAIQGQEKDLATLTRLFGTFFRDQKKFLRHVGVLPKIETRTIGVSVNLPCLPIGEEELKEAERIQTSNGDFMTPSHERSSKVPKIASNEQVETIDLTDDADDPGSSNSACATTNTDIPSTSRGTLSFATPSALAAIKPREKALKHPAPLPPVPDGEDKSKMPPQPRLKISVDKSGIVLLWDFPPDAKDMKITGFEIFGYQEKKNVHISPALWKKIGRVEPTKLPMACTLTPFMEGFKYHFTIRAINNDDISGPFSDPASVSFELE